MSNAARALVVSALVFVACTNAPPSTLVRTVAEPAGANCASGGLAIQLGPDTNANSTLDADEVNASLTNYLCNGTTGTAGTTGPTGAAGSTGATGAAGQPGSTGDAGISGFSALTTIVAEAAGTNCTYGGSRVDIGHDTDRDGTLEVSEVTTSTYVCEKSSIDAIYFGDITINHEADLAILAHIQVVVGTVYFNIMPDAGISLPDLRQVTGSLYVNNNSEGLGGNLPPPPPPLPEPDAGAPSSLSISLPSLISVQELGIQGQPALTAFSAPKLAIVSYQIDLNNDSLLSSVDLSSLTSVSYFEMRSDPRLTSVSLPVLSTVYGLNISQNEALTSVALPLLATSGNLKLEQNPLLTTISLPLLSAANELSVDNDTALVDLALPELQTNSYFTVYQNPALTSIELPKLATTYQFEVYSNAALSQCAVTRQFVAFSPTPGGNNISDNDTSVTCTHADLCRAVTITGITDTIQVCPSSAMSFDDARTECQRAAAAGNVADLMWFTSRAELVAYQAVVGTTIPGNSWVGYSDVATEGTFVSVVPAAYDPTTDLDVTFWHSGEPNDSGGNEDYVGLYSDGQANDFTPGSTLVPVCRISAALP